MSWMYRNVSTLLGAVSAMSVDPFHPFLTKFEACRLEKSLGWATVWAGNSIFPGCNRKADLPARAWERFVFVRYGRDLAERPTPVLVQCPSSDSLTASLH